jgi:chromate transporter
VRLYQPDWTSFDWRAAVLAAVAGVLVFGSRWSVVRVLGVSALGGLILGLAIP